METHACDWKVLPIRLKVEQRVLLRSLCLYWQEELGQAHRTMNQCDHQRAQAIKVVFAARSQEILLVDAREHVALRHD